MRCVRDGSELKWEGQLPQRSAEEGASGTIWAATLDNEGPTTGGFFRDVEPINW